MRSRPFFVCKSTKMEYFVFYSLALCLVVFGVAKAFYSIWWRPKLVERQLKRQGVRGSSYKPLVGDAKEYVSMITEAWSTPMNLDHQIIQRVDPFTAVYAKKYGMLYRTVSCRVVSSIRMNLSIHSRQCMLKSMVCCVVSCLVLE